ncbi:phosphate signaling complex protein PhoU [Candidatus Thorarchaeota archaeon]|nr:MAG: phosphate signaling complex protein PhoU [Candidatus Thorarchaeota archaeon]
MRTQLEFYLEEIERRLERLHELVEKAFMDSMDSFKNLDQEAAAKVKELATDIDELEGKIEENVLETIGRRQPVAKDLRKLSVYLQTAHNLHRVGRYAYKIAHITYLCKEIQHFKELISLPHLAELAKSTLEIAMRGVLKSDLSKLDELEKLESESDKETSDMFNEIAQYLREQNGIEEMALFYMIIGRYCERAADQAFQIAEKAVYMVKGKRVRLGLAYKGKASLAPH